MKQTLGLILVIVGVIGNNLVYLQDMWLGQEYISLDSWRAYGGIIISIVVVLIGCWLMYTGGRQR